MPKEATVIERAGDAVTKRPTLQADPGGVAETSSSSYGQIFKSTALVGGSSAINIVLRIVRTKVVAVLLGPAGMGLFALFNSISELTRTFASLGMNESGVRQIAAACGSNDTERVAITVTTLRRLSLLMACFASILLAVFSRSVARLTFGDEAHAGEVLLLSVAVFFSTITEAQRALIQGMRRVGDLARLSVLGAFFGTVFSIPLVYFFRERGVVYSIVCVMATSVATSWWFARKVKVKRLSLRPRQMYGEAAELLKLGGVLMACWLLPLGVAYGIRVIIQHRFGTEATGLYQAAWVISELYVGFILQAMGMDFYPRLTAACDDDAKCNRLINEQTEVGLLIAGPCLLATLSLAPLIIHAFYSAKFTPAIELLRWNCLGMLLRVAIAPMAIVQLAKGKRTIHFWIQFTRNAAYAVLALIGINLFGLLGAAMAFCGMVLIHALISHGVARRLSGFRYSTINRQYGGIFMALSVVLLVVSYVVPFSAALVLGITVTAVTGAYSLKMLASLIPFAQMPPAIKAVVKLARIAPAARRN